MDSTPGPPSGSGDRYGWWFNTFRFYEENQCLLDTRTNSPVCPAGSAPSYMGGPLSWAYWPVNGTFANAWSYAQARWHTCYGNREGWGVVGGDWVAPSTPLLLQSLFSGPSTHPAAMLAVATPPSDPWPTGACVSYSNAPTPTPTASATPTPCPEADDDITGKHDRKAHVHFDEDEPCEQDNDDTDHASNHLDATDRRGTPPIAGGRHRSHQAVAPAGRSVLAAQGVAPVRGRPDRAISHSGDGGAGAGGQAMPSSVWLVPMKGLSNGPGQTRPWPRQRAAPSSRPQA
jgi:hypothetical protein